MKSFSLFKLFLLAVFVISAEANTKDQINQKITIDNGGYKVWLNEVSGYDRNDPLNGYAGVLGNEISSIRIDGGDVYRVHLLELGKWLGETTKNDQNDPNGYAGHITGKPIDAIAIGGGVEYAVHILGEDWLPAVKGYDTEDSNSGYAGILGKPIDAVMIKNRTYAVSYTDYNTSSQTQSNGGGDCNCNCTTENTTTKNNTSNGNTLNAFNILTTILSISIIMAIF